MRQTGLVLRNALGYGVYVWKAYLEVEWEVAEWGRCTGSKKVTYPNETEHFTVATSSKCTAGLTLTTSDPCNADGS